MSKPREKWWGYVKACIRDYPADGPVPDLTGQRRKEYEGVRLALEETGRLPSGRDRLAVIRMVFLARSHTLLGAAQSVHVSERTVRRWHGDFIRLTAYHMGLENLRPNGKVGLKKPNG